MDAPIIDMHGIVKRFPIGTGEELEVLHGIDLTVRKGEFVAIVGASGTSWKKPIISQMTMGKLKLVFRIIMAVLVSIKRNWRITR